MVDRIQTITTVINATTGARSETLTNRLGNNLTTAVTANVTVTTTSADGKSVTIQRDATGGGWFGQVETRVKAPDTNGDGSSTNTTTNYARDGITIISKVTEQVSANGQSRTEQIDADGNTTTDTRVAHQISMAAGVITTAIVISNQDNSLRTQEKEVLAANGRDKVISRDKDGNGVFSNVFIPEGSNGNENLREQRWGERARFSLDACSVRLVAETRQPNTQTNSTAPLDREGNLRLKCMTGF